MKRFTQTTVDELLKDYAVSKRLRTALRYNLETVTWDEKEFIVLTNKQSSEGVLLSDTPGAEVVQYELRKRGASQSGRIEAIICDICKTWQSGPRSATITFQKERGSATFLVCADLACSDHVRDRTDAAAVSRTQLREHTTIDDRIDRLRLNLTHILR